MRVLVLHSELGVLRGGGENFTRNLFDAFAERGHRVAAAFVADQRNHYPLALPPNIQPIPLRGWWSRNFGQALLSSLGHPLVVDDRLKKKWDHFQNAIAWRTIRWHNHRFRNRIERQFGKRWNSFDAVYVHGDAALAAAVTRYRPTVLRLPGPLTVEAEPILRTVHAVCANGDALASIQKFLGNHATELPVGLNDELFRPGPTTARSKIGWSCQHRVIGYVGRLTRLKGVDILAAAFQEISEYLPNTRLLIIGRGEEEHRLRSTLAQKFSHGGVHIEPDVNHEELAEWYRAMDLLVMPSRYENFSNALIEAMACGVPFLASDVGGNKIVAKTGAGWLFESDSVAALSACLRMILQDPAERQRRGKIGLQYAGQHYSWDATAKRLEEILFCRLGVAR
jgi:glycosyltransferase involved in cell wall biosynthesis